MGCAASTPGAKQRYCGKAPRSFAGGSGTSGTSSAVTSDDGSAPGSQRPHFRWPRERTVLSPETLSPHNYDGARHFKNAKNRAKKATKRAKAAVAATAMPASPGAASSEGYET